MYTHFERELPGSELNNTTHNSEDQLTMRRRKASFCSLRQKSWALGGGCLFACWIQQSCEGWAGSTTHRLSSSDRCCVIKRSRAKRGKVSWRFIRRKWIAYLFIYIIAEIQETTISFLFIKICVIIVSYEILFLGWSTLTETYYYNLLNFGDVFFNNYNMFW